MSPRRHSVLAIPHTESWESFLGRGHLPIMVLENLSQVPWTEAGCAEHFSRLYVHGDYSWAGSLTLPRELVYHKYLLSSAIMQDFRAEVVRVQRSPAGTFFHPLKT